MMQQKYYLINIKKKEVNIKKIKVQGGSNKMKINFEKKGINFEVIIERNVDRIAKNIFAKGIKAKINSVWKHTKTGWLYEIRYQKEFGKKIFDTNKNTIYLVHDSGEKAYREIKRLEQEIIKEKTEKAQNLEPIGYEYIMGCDAASTYRFIFAEKIDYDLIEMYQKKNAELCEAIKKLDFEKYANFEKTVELESTMMSYGGWQFYGKAFEMILADAEKEIIKTKEKTDREWEEKLKKNREEKEEIRKNEIRFIDHTQLLSSANFQMIHSIAGKKTKEKISIYNTMHTRNIPNANTTYTISNLLREKGFKWNAAEKKWEIENTEENEKVAIEILKKHDTKMFPREAGLQQCWECGQWRKHLDANGYCGC